MRTRKINPGNTGHGGYKMRTIVRFEPGTGATLLACLECGHSNAWPLYVGLDGTPEQAQARDLPDYTARYVGTRARCEQCKAVQA